MDQQALTRHQRPSELARLQAENKQLRKLNELQADLAVTVAGEVDAGASVIAGFADLLAAGDPLSTRQQDVIVRNIVRHIGRMRDVVENLRRTSALLSHDEHAVPTGSEIRVPREADVAPPAAVEASSW